jgi:hypothetical protein
MVSNPKPYIAAGLNRLAQQTLDQWRQTQMTNLEELELRIVEVKEPLTPTKLPGSIRTLQRRPAPTRAQALEALQATKGAASLIERIPALGQIGVWGELASWNACQTTGAAEGGVFLWGCDFPGASWTMFDGSANCLPYFAGSENFEGIAPPRNITGQVWCYLNAPVDATYLFVAQLETYMEDYAYPGYTASVDCFIDSEFLGKVTFPTGVVVNPPFLVGLSAGLHNFQIVQVSGAFFFLNLTAWVIPVIRP